jgi:hypothetical protein
MNEVDVRKNKIKLKKEIKEELEKEIKYIHTGLGMMGGYVILGLKEVE